MKKKHRRGRGEGSIYQRTDGLWEGQMTVGYDPITGKQQRKTVQGKTRQEVVDKLLEMRQKAQAGKVELTNMNVRVCLEFWLGSVKNQLAPGTYDYYKRVVNKSLVPYLGQLPLAKLSALHVANLYRKMEEDSLSQVKRHKAGVILRSALKYAVNLGLIHTNPATKVPLPKYQAEKITPLSLDEARRFLEAAKSDRLFALYITALDSGARRGELSALEWSDIDWDTGEISITKSVEELRGKFRVKETKTKASRRRVKLSPQTLEVLKIHRCLMEAEGHNCPRVFCASNGGYLRGQDLPRNSIRPICKRAGLKPFRFHNLRHTCATLLLLGGVNVKVVSERLGHSKIQITLDTYSHVLPVMQEGAAKLLGDILHGRRPPNGDGREISRS
jgi:integrase